MSFCHSVHSEPFRPHILSILLYLYRPPMKLWESNAFNYVCLSTRGRCHVTITHNAWDLPVGPPPPTPPHGHGSSLYRDRPSPGNITLLYTPPPVTSGGQHWKPVQTCLLEGPPLYSQGSHSDWKTWKNGKAFSSQGKVREF